jgi:hypothetical protein
MNGREELTYTPGNVPLRQFRPTSWPLERPRESLLTYYLRIESDRAVVRVGAHRDSDRVGIAKREHDARRHGRSRGMRDFLCSRMRGTREEKGGTAAGSETIIVYATGQSAG